MDDTMKIEVKTITPDIAAKILDTSDGNRPLKAAKVKSYARDMGNGLWVANGESIIINKRGVLVDGHHRLKACVESGATFRSVVVTGVAESARDTIDMGASRTVGDVLSFHGLANSNQVAAAAIALQSLINGVPRSANMSSQEVLSFISAHPAIEHAAVISSRKYMPRCGAILGALYVVAHETGHSRQYDIFLDVLRDGFPSMRGCAAHALRDRLLRDAASKNPMSLRDVHRTVIAAWNKFICAEPVKTIRLPSEYKAHGWPLRGGS